jgi:hypothetical protein
MNYNIYADYGCTLKFEIQTYEDMIEITVKESPEHSDTTKVITFHPDYFETFKKFINTSYYLHKEDVERFDEQEI